MQQKKFLTAQWKNLIMANYIVDPKILEKHLPAHTELDLWNGNCYVSLVAFMFLDTKVLGIPVPFHRHFEEVNLRFYVRHKAGDVWKRGVVFIKEIVPKWAITFVANNLYGEHYHTLSMKNELEETDKQLKVGYFWNFKKAWNYIKVTCPKPSKPMQAGGEAEFIAEHYWGYTKLDDQRTSEYEVAHPEWNVYEVQDFELNCNIGELYGSEFAEPMQGQPSSIFMAEGSEIAVHKGITINNASV